MSLSDLSSAQLQHLIELIQEKESLQRQLAKVDTALARLDGGSPAPRKFGKRRARKVKGAKGATLKEKVLDVLAKAGPSGLSVKDLAAKAGVKLGSLSVWIYTTGKKVPGLKKIAPGRYTYSEK